MQLPADLLAVRSALVTNAVAGVAGVVTILAAPGAGLRYRLWSAILSTRTGGAAVALVEVGLRSPAGTYVVFPWGVQRTGSTSRPVDMPGGLACPENSLVETVDLSDVAAQPYTLTLFYTLERV